MARLIALFALLLAGAAPASEWQYGAFDNGAWFEAHVGHQSRELGFHCGGPSPGGQPLPQSDEPMLTQPYTLQVTLAQPGLGGGSLVETVPPRADIVIVAGSTGYRLPGAAFDELNVSGWIQPLGMGDALVAALFSAPALAVDDARGRHGVYGADGFGPALTRMIAFCDARWAATGQPLPAAAVAVVDAVRRQGVDISPTVTPAAPAAPPVPPAPAAPQAQAPAQGPRSDDSLWQAVQAHIATACEGAVSTFHEGYARYANLDGDGVQDIVISWDSIECAGPMTRPFCGASQCAVDVFVSSAYAPGGWPETVYAQAVEIVPGPEGRDLLRLAGRLALCNEPGAPPDCLFLWGWTNGALQRMN